MAVYPLSIPLTFYAGVLAGLFLAFLLCLGIGGVLWLIVRPQDPPESHQILS